MPHYPNDELAIDNAASQLELMSQLVAIRNHRGMSQNDVAERISKNRSQISKLESGETNPTISSLERYAEAVGAHLVRIAVASECRAEWIEVAERVTDALDEGPWIETTDVIGIQGQPHAAQTAKVELEGVFQLSDSLYASARSTNVEVLSRNPGKTVKYNHSGQFRSRA